jgi:Flp pilus assembly protein TadG
MRETLRRFAQCRRGLAATEFAFVAPIMIGILGLAHVSGEALAVAQKVSATARTITDIVTRNQAVSATDLATILNAASVTMAPYASDNLAMVVSQVTFDAKGAGKVVWSQKAYNGEALTPGASFSLPSGQYQNGGTYIVGSVSYAYKPLAFSLPFMGAITLSDQTVWAPRNSPSVDLTN